jgi:hypothetical protein
MNDTYYLGYLPWRGNYIMAMRVFCILSSSIEFLAEEFPDEKAKQELGSIMTSKITGYNGAQRELRKSRDDCGSWRSRYELCIRLWGLMNW